MKLTRRELLAGIMAGGVMTAAGLWMPGTKMISIPSRKQFIGPSIFEIMGEKIKYIGPENKTATIQEFYDWLKMIENNQVMDGAKSSGTIVSLRNDYRLENPEHLVAGTLAQAAGNKHGLLHQREHWSCCDTLGEADLFTDKVYHQA